MAESYINQLETSLFSCLTNQHLFFLYDNGRYCVVSHIAYKQAHPYLGARLVNIRIIPLSLFA